MIKKWLEKIEKITFSIRFAIISAFIVFFILTVWLILGTTSIRLSEALNYISRSLMQESSRALLNAVNEGIKPATIESDFTAYLLEKGVLTPEQLVPYGFYLLQNLPLIQGIAWGNEKGNFILSLKQTDGSVTTRIFDHTNKSGTLTMITQDTAGKITKRITHNNYAPDIRLRSWYQKAKKEKKLVWSDPYLFIYPPQQLVITTAAPIFTSKREFSGMFGIAISLDYLTKFLTTQKVGSNGYSFIISEDKLLIAYPKRKPFTDVIIHPDRFIDISRSALPLINKSFSTYLATGKKELRVDYNDQKYLVSYEPIEQLVSQKWLVGVVVPESDFIAPLENMKKTVLLEGILFLIIGIFLVSRIVKRIVRPLKLLVAETQDIKKFKFQKNITIDSRMREIITLRDALESMKLGLKSFQRYVPDTLVRQLIESGKDLKIGGIRKELVVFFSDIENFSLITGKMDPNTLMLQICEYFEELTDIIVQKEGTIDKYIGDAIMAFWGAPLSNIHACHHAALSALRCQEKVASLNKKWAQEGKPEFQTRIGLHMGNAVVGNLGSSWRLSYTAIGDPINIASKLERLNKVYKTKIIVSDVVYQKIKDKFVLRLIDYFPLKLNSEVGYIYELLGDDPRKIPFDIDAYREAFSEGFSAYQEKKRDMALFYFRKCLEIYPGDTIAPIFLERCEY